MAALWSKEFVVVHVPKCGGSWVRQALQGAGYNISMDMADNHSPAPRTDYPTYVFIRHPAAWLASWWAHCDRNGWLDDGPLPEGFKAGSNPYHKMMSTTCKYKSANFEEFVHDLLTYQPEFVTRFFAPYMETATRIGRVETLRRDLEHLTGTEMDTPPYNVGENTPVVSEGLMEFVAQREDMEAFGYA